MQWLRDGLKLLTDASEIEGLAKQAIQTGHVYSSSFTD